jgi:hypothetical protein
LAGCYKKLWKGYSIVLFAISHLILGLGLRMLFLVLLLYRISDLHIAELVLAYVGAFCGDILTGLTLDLALDCSSCEGAEQSNSKSLPAWLS